MDCYEKSNSKTEIIISGNKNLLAKIKSEYFLKKLFFNLSVKKKLDIIKYNKKAQNIASINIDDYKKFNEKYTPIEIEIIPDKDKYGNFINLIKDNSYYHIYFNDRKEEIHRNYITANDKVKKIKIIINYNVKSFENLFQECACIKSINFIKFYRNDIVNMSKMFFECISLKEIKFSNFNTKNVTNMSKMFNSCVSLKEINLKCSIAVCH